MNDKINSNYVDSYSGQFSEKICADYFGTKKYMNGQEIIRLTSSNQVNLMIIKTLFNAWQDELEKLKSNPFFDYKDYAVNEALKEFMNVLSRAIKIERSHFQPLLKKAIKDTILLAADPVAFFSQEIDQSNQEQRHNHFKESKKYIKWHPSLLTILIEKSGLGASSGELKRALVANFDFLKDQLEPASVLLSSLDQDQTIRYNELFVEEEPVPQLEEDIITDKEEKPITTAPELSNTEEQPSPPQHQAAKGSNAIDPALAWAKFESEQYGYMKENIGNLSENVGLNQRFMFTKVLFDGNHDLMMHALKSVDESESFVDAIEMLNQRYVAELNWDIDSDEVGEFLQLVFRKFDYKS